MNMPWHPLPSLETLCGDGNCIVVIDSNPSDSEDVIGERRDRFRTDGLWSLDKGISSATRTSPLLSCSDSFWRRSWHR